MNARNLDYVQKYNSKASKYFADDKLYTKNFLESRGLGVAKIFQVLKNEKQLENLSFKSMPNSFALKPNKGFGGEGILVIKEKTKRNFVTISGKKISWEELKLHAESILEGAYAINGSRDQVIIEELLGPHEIFKPFLETSGLPDLRIIVFNLVPVLAMLRVPTEESEGKGNLALGAIGIGVDVATGKTTHAYRNGKYFKKLSNGDLVNGIQIPNWEEVLKTASKAQQATGIGYLGIDLAITKTGLKVLELNARPGLKIQICNRIPLKTRLKLAASLKILNPEKAVEAAKTLFGKEKKEKKEEQNSKKVVGLYEPVNFFLDGVDTLMAKIDPFSEENYLDKKLLGEAGVVDFSIQGKRQKANFLPKIFREKNYSAVIGRKQLKDFFIDSSLKRELNSQLVDSANEKILKNLDKNICELDKKIKIMSYLKPLNLESEKKKFLQHPKFNPKFKYREVNEEEIEELKKEFGKLQIDLKHSLIGFFKEKIEEMKLKIQLIEKRGTLEFGEISDKIFGKVTPEDYKEAINFIKNHNLQEDKSEILKLEKLEAELDSFLKEKGLKTWKLKKIPFAAANMSVSKDGLVFLSEKAKISKNRLKALLAHEIETHVFRGENSKNQDYEIFKRGTAGYLETEEGLAIFNQERTGMPLGEKEIGKALNLIAVYMGRRMSFLELFHYLVDTFGLNEENSWKKCVKVKRGLSNTSLLTSFSKDAIYFKGGIKVEKFVETATEEEIKTLYSAKIKIEDLKKIKESNLKLKHGKLISEALTKKISELKKLL